MRAVVCRRGTTFIFQKCWENFATTSPKERKMDLKRGNHMTPNSAWLLDFGTGQMVGASKENPGETEKIRAWMRHFVLFGEVC